MNCEDCFWKLLPCREVAYILEEVKGKRRKMDREQKESKEPD